MATVRADPDVSLSERLAQERRLQQCLRALRAWLGAAAHSLGAAHGPAASCAWPWPCRRPSTPSGFRGAARGPEPPAARRGGGWVPFIYQLVIEGAEPAQVAAERGVSRPALVEMLRDAVDDLAVAYEDEDVAYASVGQSPQEQVRRALARKRG